MAHPFSVYNSPILGSECKVFLSDNNDTGISHWGMQWWASLRDVVTNKQLFFLFQTITAVVTKIVDLNLLKSLSVVTKSIQKR
jgi:hypothetical protein